uniref:DJ-1 n=2 Tax=Caligus rogercresseyi TaxID=217165 RepID=C1BMZ9_CALRO|nr:DJ-1 [Caligus rogercresseyi]|eukprot:TRINITY_DN25796_c0_g1_i1.p1 TRINITY_DN25796_c0_g1~~TRINITY_DN25796_c0_g1_i1.p1  ORF type:complete len:187 (+),score=54.50 TRINITY_DN25796_c0_g1_i1:85-645(+)
MSSKRALVLLAEGAEEIETSIIVDVLRRADVSTVLGGLGSDTSPVNCSRDMKFVPDKALKDITNESFDAIVLPGGLKGSQNLAASPEVKVLLEKQLSGSGILAAICAAPTVISTHGLAKDRKITSYPCFKDEFVKSGYTYVEEDVVVDGPLITSRGPGTAFAFALKLVEKLTDLEKANDIKKAMLL